MSITLRKKKNRNFKQMKNWETFEITNNFDNSVIQISWNGIKLKDAQREVIELAKNNNKNVKDFKIKKI